MRIWRKIFYVVILFFSASIRANDIPVGSVPVSIQLTSLPKITVEKPGGGWYDIVELTNASGSDLTRYQVQLPIQISIRNERNFMVSLSESFVLSKENDTSKTFSNEQVSFGSDSDSLQVLGLTPVNFINPPLIGDTSTGNYYLSISAHQPMGSMSSVSGRYISQLVIMFEVKA